jgi:RNA polymerase sigma-70 factor (ECF subfamily)
VAVDSPFDALVARLRSGDPDAAAELVRRYEPAIRAAIRGLMADTRLRRLFDSMDVCQTVLVSFLPGWPSASTS